MSTIYLITAVVLIVGAFMLLYRALAGPTVYDTILATNAIGTKTIVFVTLLGYISGRTEFIDMAIIYALITFITTIAILKYIEKGRLD
ncbi:MULTISPECIES: monovalent cation/H+ antiporter complex subunit F [Nannocystis]|uniref:Monovalent cation/H+ antiporter complex subunit F n=1 Tax=Nannocystis punicea TaxID=2995304 RepID=A0ABY7HE41_9BACT|nr:MULTISPECIES: monovalent cation/H+ antiporter complex subunit F [Nannocystis]MCY0990066.1 monovalent cation/H+ antiporter complex subunit F [Nannocystis sp. ILAH1]MCY0994969.1 monovalent cation/H+ antiporter complex subunit F [Nannocystis sp. ILAH1]MCY1069645.1 monovalent cation/H+ antiporter complex subunit F [Nannocystis sp. RBIL2]WAS97542.1 monovalent cation/H+ antiporter complex subunit F [Nannocystis poenicansa]